MARFERRFVRSIYKNTGGFFPSWPLGRQVKLGDIISIRRRRMDYLGNVSDPAISIHVEVGPDITGDTTRWQSKSNVSISVKAMNEVPEEGSRLPIDKAGIGYEFSRQGGFIFQPSGVKYNRIENLVTVRNEAIEKLTAGLFNMRNIYIVKEVAVVDSYALTISQSRKGKLEVAVEGDISISTEDLARVDLELQIKTEDHLDFNVVGKEGGSLFYKGEKLKLRNDRSEELRSRTLANNDLSDDLLASLLPPSELTPENARDYFGFEPMYLDDLEELIGSEEEDEFSDLV